MVRNRYIDLKKLNSAIATAVNVFADLDVVKAWGYGTAVAADGTQVETYIDNLLAESSIWHVPPESSWDRGRAC